MTPGAPTKATFFDGENSRGISAVVTVRPATLWIDGPNLSLRIPLDQLQVSDPLGTLPRKLSWGTPAFLSMESGPATALLDQLVGPHNPMNWVAQLESKLIAVILASILTLMALVWAAIYGVPLFADGVAKTLPQTMSAKLGESALSQADSALKPSTLSTQTRSELRTLLHSHEPQFDIHFRYSPSLGANAFVLSATTIIFTDSIVQQLSEEELLAVFFHEVGHAQSRHVERMLIQGAAWAMLGTYVTGDLGGMAELMLTLPLTFGQAAYSRAFEREADAYAVERLKAIGITPLRLADALEKLSQMHSTGSDERSGVTPEHSTERAADNGGIRRLLEAVASHPMTDERLAYIKASAKP